MNADILAFEDITSAIPMTSVISIAGAGGKTTLMLRLAEYLPGNAAVTTTTKVGSDQIKNAEIQLTCEEFPPCRSVKSVWVSPSLDPVNGKIRGCSLSEFSKLAERCKTNGYFLINEADGAARRHIKAPAAHEPVIPPETTICVYVVGLDVLGLQLNDQNVHRPELFCNLTGAESGDIIKAEHIIRLYEHPQGGLKGMPADSLRIAYMTHADTDERISAGQIIAESLKKYDIICMNR